MSLSKLPPSATILPANSYVGRLAEDIGQGSAINYDELSTGPTITQAEFTAMVAGGGPGYYEGDPSRATEDAYLKVVLPAGAVITIDNSDVPRIEDWTWITSDPSNPARFVMDQDQVIMLLCIYGSNIIIEHVLFDFNTGPQWNEFKQCIKFAPPQAGSQQDQKIVDNVTIRRCVFHDSRPPVNKYDDYTDPNSGTLSDNWCLNFNTNSTEISKNLQIIENVHVTRPFTQLTSGGYGPGWDGVVIRGNITDRCIAGAIQVTNAESLDPGNVIPMNNFIVEDNVMLRCSSGGVYIGYDGFTGDYQVDCKNAVIRRNYIELGPYSPFPQGIWIRCAGVGTVSQATIEDNTIVGTLSTDAGNSPRYISITAAEDFDLHFRGNSILGLGTRWLFNGIGQPTPYTEYPDQTLTSVARSTVQQNAPSFAVEDATGAVLSEMKSNGTLYTSSKLGVGIETPSKMAEFFGTGSNGILVGSANWSDIILRSDTDATSSGPYDFGLLLDPTNGDLYMQRQAVTQILIGDSKILMPTLPTSDPGRAGQLWNEAGTLKVSAG